jgi:hypothetical protein
MKSGRDKDGWRKKIERREEINNDLHCGSKTINIGVSVGWWCQRALVTEVKTPPETKG